MKFQSVLSTAPLRISFLGGGSDIATYYEESPGAVVSAAIDKYVYVHIKRHDPLFQERYRISYSEIEYSNSRSEIHNDIARSCLEYLEIDEPLQISTSADLPANSGLGSSSSFAVALLLGLHAMRGEEISPIQVAEEACSVEIGILKSPIGKQDQYAAAFGGLNFFNFSSDGRVNIEPLYLPNVDSGRLLEKIVLVWTGESRKANVILADQAARSSENFINLGKNVELAKKFKDSLLQPELNWETLGEMIRNGWEIKKTLSPQISNEQIHSITSCLDNLDCLGYKLLGAGGGGFVLALMNSVKPDTLNSLNKWNILRPNLDHMGARVVSLK